MMMVVTVMAVALHLIETLRGNLVPCQLPRVKRLYATVSVDPGSAVFGSWSKSMTCRYKRLRVSNRSEARVT